MRYRPGYRQQVDRHTEAATLYESGLTLREVGQRLGVSYQTISNWLTVQGVHRRKGLGKRQSPRPTPTLRLARQVVTRERYEEVMATQPAECQICGGQQNGRRRLCLDHDHTTGELRGWLCANCNTGIGMLSDDADALRRAAAYLEGAPHV